MPSLAPVKQAAMHALHEVSALAAESVGAPAIKLDNHEAINDYYRGHMPNERIVRFGEVASSFAINPQTSFAPGSEQELGDHLSDDGVVFLLSDHKSNFDPFTLVGMFENEEVFNPMLTNTIIPTKVDLLKIMVLRKVLEGMGSIAAFREQDLVLPKDHLDYKTLKRMLSKSGIGLISIVAEHLINGDHAGLFPEGTRNKVDLTRLQDIESGAAVIYRKVFKALKDQDRKIGVLPVSIDYAGKKRKPTTRVGNLITTEFADTGSANTAFASAIQLCMDEAIGLRKK